MEEQNPGTLQIVGAHFLGQVAVSLDSRRAAHINQQFEVWVGDQLLGLPSVVWVDDGSLTVQLPDTLKAGTYGIRIKTPGQQWATLSGNLIVEAGPTASAELTDAGVTADPSTDTSVTANANTDTDAGDEPRPRLKTQGRQILDPCGEPIVIRGVEQVLASALPAGTDILEVLENITDSGVNAVRIELPEAPNLTKLAAMLETLADRSLLTFLSPPDNAWLGETEVQSVLLGHDSHLIIDALHPKYDDRERFVSEALAAVEQVRGYGYKVPLFIRSNTYGRDLPALLQSGAQIMAADPLQNVVLGWTAWWGESTNWYQRLYDLSWDEGAAAAASAEFPIVLGLTYQTDRAPEDDDFMDYRSAMTTALNFNLGWTWSSWYNPNDTNSLSRTGSATELLALGQEVVTTHPAGIANTSRRTCPGQ